MSFSYAVGSNTRIKNSSRRNNANVGVKSPSTTHPAQKSSDTSGRGRGYRVTSQRSNNHVNSGAASWSNSQTANLGNGPRIVTLSDLSRNESNAGAKSKSKQQPKAANSTPITRPKIGRTVGRVNPLASVKNSSYTYSNTSSPTRAGRSNNSHTATNVKSSQPSAASRGKMWDDSGTSGSHGQRPPAYSTAGSGRPVGRPDYREMPPETSPNTRGTNPHQPRHGEPVYNAEGGYTTFAPDPRRRARLQNQASSELQRYDAHRQQQRVNHVSIRPAAAGGGWVSEEEARRRAEREQQNKKYENIRKRQQWEREKKEREERENAEKKAKAREQAERNQRRQQEDQQRRGRELAHDHIRANEAFLRRLERQQAQATSPYNSNYYN